MGCNELSKVNSHIIKVIKPDHSIAKNCIINSRTIGLIDQISIVEVINIALSITVYTWSILFAQTHTCFTWNSYMHRL